MNDVKVRAKCYFNLSFYFSVKMEVSEYILKMRDIQKLILDYLNNDDDDDDQENF